MLTDMTEGRFLARWLADNGLDKRVPRPLTCLIGLVPQLSCYTVISGLALGLDLGIYLGLAHFGIQLMAAGVIGYGIGMLLHYALSIRFVFEAKTCAKSDARLFTEFVVTSLVGISLTAIIIAMATGPMNVGPLPAKIIAVAVSFLAVFALRKSIVFTAATSRGD